MHSTKSADSLMNSSVLDTLTKSQRGPVVVSRFDQRTTSLDTTVVGLTHPMAATPLLPNMTSITPAFATTRSSSNTTTADSFTMRVTS